eukprot:m.32714 g.32714  ORF g.32714 m.32714 type:complete len:133 (-) comp16683_c1_seq1:696-1094(-)
MCRIISLAHSKTNLLALILFCFCFLVLRLLLGGPLWWRAHFLRQNGQEDQNLPPADDRVVPDMAAHREVESAAVQAFDHSRSEDGEVPHGGQPRLEGGTPITDVGKALADEDHGADVEEDQLPWHEQLGERD